MSRLRTTVRIDQGPLPSPAAVAAGNARLHRLLTDSKQFLSSTDVGFALARDRTHPDPKGLATIARKASRIFGVWDGVAYHYPCFQFDADGQPKNCVTALIDALPRDAAGSWREAALWLFQPDAALDGRTPAAVFVEDPLRVIELARRRRGDDPYSD